MKHDKLMLLIDADNVSVGVIEQAMQLLMNQHGAVHVRRAYCTAESALKNQALFKHLGIKPMVNLAAGKNSTDIALAVDAIDLVLAERPDVVVILSSDSDFAPLVLKLREKGCVVRGIGQQGKTGDETQGVYDDYTVLEHRAPMLVPSPAPRAPRAARKTAVKKAPATKAATKTPARKTATPKTAATVDAPPPAEAATAAEPAPKPTRRSRSKAVAAEVMQALAVVGAPAPAPAPPAEPAMRAAGPTCDELLSVLPELAQGQELGLNVAVQRLRAAGLLGKSASSIKLFARFGGRFELGPPDHPALVRLRPET
jgi:uncharacterized protein (TIGR00288 family)